MAQNEPGGSERRKHKRLLCDGFAEVIAFHAKVFFRGKIKDISESGCFIETRAHLNLSRFAEVEVRFILCGLKRSVLARAMDVRPGKGVGFEFLAADPRLDQAFHKMIDRLRAPQSLLA